MILLRADCHTSWEAALVFPTALNTVIICWRARGDPPVMVDMSLIHWLNQHPIFIEEVTLQVQEEMVGREVEHPSDAGGLAGEVIRFKLMLPIQLEFSECVGLTCAIPFKAVGVATCSCRSPSGEEITFTREGQVYGVVDVRFPEEGWSPEAYLRMYPHIERIVNVESVEFTDLPA